MNARKTLPMRLKKLQLQGFKSFAHKSEFIFDAPISAIVGPNGSGKSNVVESIRFVLGEQSMKSLRGAAGTDLIFKGLTDAGARSMNRAAVAITLDNKDRVFLLSSVDNAKIPVDFDEIVIAREVYADGQNKYLINGNEVRLKDIMELIASVNIGSSGHHMISQGEADRLLNANSKERRVMLEDALGLKVYQYRIKETQRKLDKTRVNLKESYTLRREIAPHLKFLKRQVEKIERTNLLRQELEEKALIYLNDQSRLLKAQAQGFTSQKLEINKEIIDLKKKMEEHHTLFVQEGNSALDQEITDIVSDIQKVHSAKGDISRSLGRLEGKIESLESTIATLSDTSDNAETQSDREEVGNVALDEVRRWIEQIKKNIKHVMAADTLDDSRERARNSIVMCDRMVKDWVAYTNAQRAKNNDEKAGVTQTQRDVLTKQLDALQKEYSELTHFMSDTVHKEAQLQERRTKVDTAIAEERIHNAASREAFYALRQDLQNHETQLNLISAREQELGLKEQHFGEEINEITALLGNQVSAYSKIKPRWEYPNLNAIDADIIQSLDDERRVIERMKIKIEEMGGGSGGDIMTEYENTLERDDFLEKEISDLESSLSELNSVIADLKDQLHKEFKQGLKSINEEFHNYFTLMFGGGQAELDIVEVQKRTRKKKDEPKILDEEGEGPSAEESASALDTPMSETGIDIRVKLPRKKVQELSMLSGGERSLTSIALLFALSQVNPPPFLVLDETDAALDEANSKKYGDMIEKLSKVSQLVVVTHNRETMSRAHNLFGVTLGPDNASQLLSVKLEEAEQYAK